MGAGVAKGEGTDDKDGTPAIRWNVQADAAASGLLGARCDAALARLMAAGPEAQLAFLCDTRTVHGALFAGLAPKAAPDAPGTYRGTPGSSLVHAGRAVFLSRRQPGLRSRDLCPPAPEVRGAMDRLALRMAALWDGGAPACAHAALAEVTHGFLAIHPYLDGNGHIYRLMMPVLAARLGLATDAGWTPHPRPYDHLISLCLQWYPVHPGLLADHLRRWFAPKSRL